MNGVGLMLTGVLVVAVVAALAWWRRRSRRWSPVSRNVRCPLHDCRAEVTALSDPAARPGRRHVEIVGCSLLSSAAVALPERRAYLADTPPCEVVLEPGTTHAVYAPEAACRQPCLFVLNAAASGTVAPLTCASGVSDGIDLMRQADGEAAGRQSLWFGSSS